MQQFHALTRLLVVPGLLALVACSPQPTLDSDIVGQADIVNLLAPEENIISSGQPTEEQFQVLADAGIRHVINLRTPQEMDFDEAALVESLGMEYHSIPVAVSAGINRENAQQLFELLETFAGEPIVVHCASGQRVGALVAVSARQNRGMAADAAMDEGRRWGLSSPRLTPVVEQVLAEI
jgi:protein tyrosine phosphatase (PTP) superfamily phosphohydrolase (DUF442 family)